MWKASRNARLSLLLGLLRRRSRIATPSFFPDLKFLANRPQPAPGAAALSITSNSLAFRLYSTMCSESPAVSGDGKTINSGHASDVLSQSEDDAMKAKLSGKRRRTLNQRYGCPSMDEIEEFNNVYKKKLDEVGGQVHIPRDLAIEVSSPGAERILKVPGDLERFRDLPMQMTYVGDDLTSRNQQQVAVFVL